MKYKFTFTNYIKLTPTSLYDYYLQTGRTPAGYVMMNSSSSNPLLFATSEQDVNSQRFTSTISNFEYRGIITSSYQLLSSQLHYNPSFRVPTISVECPITGTSSKISVKLPYLVDLSRQNVLEFLDLFNRARSANTWE